MSYRKSSDGKLEVLHPETDSYVPAQALLQATGGHEVRLNAAQQALLTQLADALIQNRNLPGAQSYLAAVNTLLNTVANNIDELEPVLKQVRDAIDIGNGNTLYARLADALVQLTAINTRTANLQTYVDGLESLVGVTNDLIALVNNTTLATTNAALTTLNALSTTLNTSVAALNAKLPASLGQQSMANSLGVVFAIDQTAIPVRTTVPASDYNAVQTSAGAVIKASAGRLFSFACSNYNTNIRYLQFFDRATAPAGAPLKVYPVYPMNTNGPGFLFLDRNFLGTDGAAFITGICWGLSTAPTTYMAAAATDCVFEARYT